MKKIIYFNKNNDFADIIINTLKKHFGNMIEFITQIPLDPKIKIDIFVLDGELDLNEDYDFESVQINKKMIYQSSSTGYTILSEKDLINFESDDLDYNPHLYKKMTFLEYHKMRSDEHIESIVYKVAGLI